MGVKERKERERLRRASDILEAARLLFEKKGFLNTTLQDVAKEAEISVGLIYRYFESKEDMFASLALKGAEAFDAEIDAILKKANSGRRKPLPTDVLYDIAQRFFAFYGPYGEYFDLLMYSVKGKKEVQIHGNTVTRLMSVTLTSLDRLKDFIVTSPDLRANDEEEALEVVFLLWGILLGSHKLFDSSGRGHLFAFGQNDFLRKMISNVLMGIGSTELLANAPARATATSKRPETHV